MGLDGIDMAEDRDKCLAVVSTVVGIRFGYSAESLLIS